MAMNVPTWANAGVSPSAEKKAEGYAAGEYLPAQHLNWFLNQTFSNLSEVKNYIDKLPYIIITGTYIGTGSSQVIDLGFEPEAVFVCAATSSVNSVDYMPFFALKNSPASYQNSKYTILSVVTNGFIPHISSGNYVQNLNRSGDIYNYIALKGVQI